MGKKFIVRRTLLCLLVMLLFVQDAGLMSSDAAALSAAPAMARAQAIMPEGSPHTAPVQPEAEAPPAPQEQEEPEGYRQIDAFANTTIPKGLQGMRTAQYGAQHTLLNIWIDSYVDVVPSDGFGYCYEYQYNGNTFYFDLSGIEMFVETVRNLNDEGVTVSMVFLVKYTPGREFLIDEAARVPGYEYYAPATTGIGREAVKAFFEFFMWRCAAWNASVDNFILGNEINNPNTWHYSGTLDAATVAYKYAQSFCDMYNIVRSYTPYSRCSIPLDHNWTHSDMGREIPGRTMLDMFNAQINSMQQGVDWCIAYHLYPAIMYNTAIWRMSGYNANSPSAMFIDGANLHVLTDYVAQSFGEQHRVMLTEQGFSMYNNNERYQAASLAITYYAAKYNPMVDSFILNNDYSRDARLDFCINGRLAETVYEMLDNGSREDRAKIERLIYEVSGMYVGQLVPGYDTAYGAEPEQLAPESGAVV